MDGLGRVSTFTAAYAAAKVLGASRGRCGAHAVDWEAAMFSGYAGGFSCQWSGAARRVALYRKLREAANRLESSPEPAASPFLATAR